MKFFSEILYLEGRFCWMSGFCLLVELYREGSAPAACAAGLLFFRFTLCTNFTLSWRVLQSPGRVNFASKKSQIEAIHSHWHMVVQSKLFFSFFFNYLYSKCSIKKYADTCMNNSDCSATLAIYKHICLFIYIYIQAALLRKPYNWPRK